MTLLKTSCLFFQREIQKMTPKDLDEMKKIHDVLVTVENEDGNLPMMAQVFNPHEDIEHTLMGFLKSRLSKLDSDQTFELAVKNNILSRISEANFAQLTTLLDVAQRNNNSATAAVLQPFISQDGSQTLLDRKQRTVGAMGNIEAELFKNADKDILQGLDSLKMLLSISKKES